VTNTPVDLVAVMTDARFSPACCRTLAACLAYLGKPASYAELLGAARCLSRSTLGYQLTQLRAAGVVTIARQNRLLVPTINPPAKWTAAAAAYLAKTTGTPLPTPPDPAADDVTTKVVDLIDAALPEDLREPVRAPGVDRDYSVELKLLDAHPALRGRIRASWLAYIERRFADKLPATGTTLAQLCDSFVHEFLGKHTRNSIAARRLANPKTDWEDALLVHVLRAADTAGFRKRQAVNAARFTATNRRQQKLPFRQRRVASHNTPPATSEPAGLTPTDATLLTDAALASTRPLAKLLQPQPA